LVQACTNISLIVKIIGWGEEENGTYWLVANSWGKEWGKLEVFFLNREGQVGPAHPRILLAHPRIKVKHIKNKIHLQYVSIICL
jgi:hypothetical protein